MKAFKSQFTMFSRDNGKFAVVVVDVASSIFLSSSVGGIFFVAIFVYEHHVKNTDGFRMHIEKVGCVFCYV